MIAEPVDIEKQLAEPKTYDDAIMRIFAKRRERGLAFSEAGWGVTYFSTATERRALSRAIARSVASGEYRPQPVDLRFREYNGKCRAVHLPAFIDHVVGSALFQLLSHNARCHGLPGVYSYLPGLTNVAAARALAGFVRAHRKRVGVKGPPLFVLQSDFEHLGLSVSHSGTMTLAPNRLSRFVRRIATRIDAASSALAPLPVSERARHLVLATNVMLDATSPFAVPGLPGLLQTTTDRGVLKDLDFRIARKIVQVATERPGVRGFHVLPPAVLRRDMGLVSLVHLRNLR